MVQINETQIKKETNNAQKSEYVFVALMKIMDGMVWYEFY